ncbi:MAG: hypothetical protein NXH78_03290 [Hyphomonadaceae bacterium]|nr:hypothetical protein [Hyphomonadaceae bacterium]
MKNLSISNSDAQDTAAMSARGNDRKTDWITSLLAALVCTAIILTGYELVLRAAGAEPNFRDNQARWSFVREAAGRDQSSDSIALLGASRIRAAVSLSELESRYPGQSVYPLGYIGRSPCAALQDLADSTDFRGTIVVSLNANWVDCRPSPYQMHRTVVRYHAEWNWARKIDGQASEFITQNLVFTDPHHSIRHLIVNTLEAGTPLSNKDYEITRKNRQLEFDFAPFSAEDLAQMQRRSRRAYIRRVGAGEGKRPDRWNAGRSLLSDAIEKITARGGQVVIVRLPTSGPLLRAEQEHFPREQFWDDLVDALPATAFLHFADDPSLSGFETPDGNHLDHRDAARFTAALFDAIERDGVDFKRP